MQTEWEEQVHIYLLQSCYNTTGASFVYRSKWLLDIFSLISVSYIWTVVAQFLIGWFNPKNNISHYLYETTPLRRNMVLYQLIFLPKIIIIIIIKAYSETAINFFERRDYP